jgi:hypothetical protein
MEDLSRDSEPIQDTTTSPARFRPARLRPRLRTAPRPHRLQPGELATWARWLIKQELSTLSVEEATD